MKLIVTGGHLTPALAFIDFVQATEPEVDFTFIGREYSQDSQKQLSREASEVAERSIRFVNLKAPRFKQASLLELLFKSVPLLRSILASWWFLARNRPAAVVSFGGYLAVPVVLAAWMHRIPVVTHEQTRTAGLANKLIARFAQKVAVSYPETTKLFPKHKTVVTGNPIRSELLQPTPERPSWFTSAEPPRNLLYITGGNQGSLVINTTIGELLPQLLKNWVVIHQTGSATATHDYKQDLEQKAAKLSKSVREKYVVREWITADELAWIFHQQPVVITRAGANTVRELEIYELPAVLIPLPFAHNQEQHKNAQYYVRKHKGVLLAQADLNPASLLSAIDQVKTGSRRRSKRRKLTTNDASKKLWKEVWSVAAL